MSETPGAIPARHGNVVLVLALAPLLEGIMRKVTARVQSRQGPRSCQPYSTS